LNRFAFTLPILLVAAAPAPASAQVCLGRTSFGAGDVQLNVAAERTTGVTGFGAGVFGGSERGFLGGVDIVNLRLEGTEGSAWRTTGAAGWQVHPTDSPDLQFCPLASIGLVLGPDSENNEPSTFTGTIGGAIGIVFGEPARTRIVPSVSARYVKGVTSLRTQFGNSRTDFEYTLLGAALGVRPNPALAIVPGFFFPVGRDAGDPLLELRVVFGRGG
jgi:hypothetical protein